MQRQPGKPDRHVYTITDEGRDDLHGWLALPPEPHKERIELLLKLFHGWEVGPAAMIAHVRGVRAQHEALLRRYDGYDDHLRREAEAPAPYWLHDGEPRPPHEPGLHRLVRRDHRQARARCRRSRAPARESWLSATPRGTTEGRHER